ncbi:hypothetical protein WDB88_13885 (plasmid) [Thioclava sp. GXIMD4216]
MRHPHISGLVSRSLSGHAKGLLCERLAVTGLWSDASAQGLRDVSGLLCRGVVRACGPINQAFSLEIYRPRRLPAEAAIFWRQILCQPARMPAVRHGLVGCHDARRRHMTAGPGRFVIFKTSHNRSLPNSDSNLIFVFLGNKYEVGKRFAIGRPIFCTCRQGGAVSFGDSVGHALGGML